MKNLLRFLAIVLAIGSVQIGLSLAEPGWFCQNPRPQGNTLLGVSALDRDTAIAVGVDGAIVKTTDGGMTWTRLVSGTSNTLESISCPEANTCIVVGYGTGLEATILHTTDAGATWTPQSPGLRIVLHSVSCPEVSTCMAVGSEGRNTAVLRTTDGGATWTRQASGARANLLGVSFVDANRGTVVGSGATILRTNTGGAETP